MRFVLWNSIPIENGCKLEPLENVERVGRLQRGVPFEGKFPAEARLRMTSRHRKATKLLDDVSNSDRCKICSPALVEYLKAQKLKNVEYLPVTILDHKGKVASKDYCIVHPIIPQDALDRRASKSDYNDIDKTQIDDVKKIVLDTSKIDPEVRLMRLEAFRTPIFIEVELAKAIRDKGFKGCSFRRLDQWGL